MKDLLGMRFGRLICIEFSCELPVGYDSIWLCQCDCGKQVSVRASNLLSGNTKSCGCTRKQNSGKRKIYGYWKYVGDRHNAKKRNLVWELSYHDWFVLTQKSCVSCGIGPTHEYKNKSTTPFFGNGIDRIDNTLGYTLDNCQTMCKICNRAKNTLSNTTWQDWILRVVNNNKHLL